MDEDQTESQDAETKDRNGERVFVGCRVRLVHLPVAFLNELADEERVSLAPKIRDVVGDVFYVQEIDGRGGAWVGQGWLEPDGSCESIMIRLDPSEIEFFD